MKIEEYLNNERAHLEKLEMAFIGLRHADTLVEHSSGTVVQYIELVLQMVDADQKIVEELAEEQKSTRMAKALIARTEQLHKVRAHLVKALSEAGNTEITV
jgi:DNA-binding phage protein